MYTPGEVWKEVHAMAGYAPATPPLRCFAVSDGGEPG